MWLATDHQPTDKHNHLNHFQLSDLIYKFILKKFLFNQKIAQWNIYIYFQCKGKETINLDCWCKQCTLKSNRYFHYMGFLFKTLTIFGKDIHCFCNNKLHFFAKIYKTVDLIYLSWPTWQYGQFYFSLPLQLLNLHAIALNFQQIHCIHLLIQLQCLGSKITFFTFQSYHISVLSLNCTTRIILFEKKYIKRPHEDFVLVIC